MRMLMMTTKTTTQQKKTKKEVSLCLCNNIKSIIRFVRSSNREATPFPLQSSSSHFSAKKERKLFSLSFYIFIAKLDGWDVGVIPERDGGELPFISWIYVGMLHYSSFSYFYNIIFLWETMGRASVEKKRKNRKRKKSEYIVVVWCWCCKRSLFSSSSSSSFRSSLRRGPLLYKKIM